MVSAIYVSEEVNDMEEEESRTELDSHANMPVVGRNAYIISDTDRENSRSESIHIGLCFYADFNLSF
jgi:hypothetical protein